MVSYTVPITTALQGMLNQLLPELRSIEPLLEYPTLAIQDLDEACRAYASQRGYDLDCVKHVMDVGVGIAATAYAHTSLATQVYIAIFTACLTALDDKYAAGSGHCAELTLGSAWKVGATCGTYKDPIQELGDQILQETEECFPSPLAPELVAFSVMGFINSLVMEDLTYGVKLRTEAVKFADYTRDLSGIADAYAVFIFPPNVPVADYIHAMPDMKIVINFINDSLSFYKEELNGETTNRISLLAQARRCSKLEMLAATVQEALDSHAVVLKILEEIPRAMEAYKAFVHGYVWFHTGLMGRYKLRDILV